MFHPHQTSQILFARWLMTLDKSSDLALMCTDGLENHSTAILPLFLNGIRKDKDCDQRKSVEKESDLFKQTYLARALGEKDTPLLFDQLCLF